MNRIQLADPTEKEVFTQNILKDKGVATLIQIKKGAVLKEHQSMVNALLVLLSGEAVYEEKERTVNLSNVIDFVRIPGKVTHKVTATEDACLLLIQ